MLLKRSFGLFLLVIVSLVFMVAARPMQETAPSVAVLVQVAIAAFVALVGWPALLSVIVLAGQFFGWFSSTVSETILLWANVIVFVGIFILAVLGKIDLVNQIDVTFGGIAQLITYILILLGVPIAFDRAKTTEALFQRTNMFQARLMRMNR